MELYTINNGNFKLDGGAMFGVVPKSLWQRTNPADENNLCTWAMRSLLIEQENKIILIDTGIGDKQSENFFKHYYLHGDDTLQKSINSLGFSSDQITDVILTHLHFDHCGGAVAWDSTKEAYDVLFKNANYWSNEKHWGWATNPNPREKASFLDENLFPIKESGQLRFVNNLSKGFNYLEELGLEILCVDGHTEKQMIPKIKYKGREIVYAADLIPTAGHIPVPYIMGYDVRPLITMVEKTDFLNEAYENEYLLFMEHDPNHQLVSLKKTEKGIRFDKSFSINEL